MTCGYAIAETRGPCGDFAVAYARKRRHGHRNRPLVPLCHHHAATVATHTSKSRALDLVVPPLPNPGEKLPQWAVDRIVRLYKRGRPATYLPDRFGLSAAERDVWAHRIRVALFCDRKIRFPSLNSADGAAAALAEHGRGAAQVYKCPSCADYHLTRGWR